MDVLCSCEDCAYFKDNSCLGGDLFKSLNHIKSKGILAGFLKYETDQAGKNTAQLAKFLTPGSVSEGKVTPAKAKFTDLTIQHFGNEWVYFGEYSGKDSKALKAKRFYNKSQCEEIWKN